MRLYVASSWRNMLQPNIVAALREDGHDVYDFKNPEPRTGFGWKDIDPNWQNWTAAEYNAALRANRAKDGFASDANALSAASMCVLVLPCGASAHLEAGWAAGNGKRLCILLPTTVGHSLDGTRACSRCGDIDGCHLPGNPKKRGWEPELMYSWAEVVTDSLTILRAHLLAHPRAHKTIAEQVP